jgi:hypothetical protein
MKRFIVILTVVLLLATAVAPVAFAATSTAPAGRTLARGANVIWCDRMCPDGGSNLCSCIGGKLLPPLKLF